MIRAKKNDWVQIQNVVLTSGNRAPQVPEDTQECDLKLWVKGIAETEAAIGEEILITTVTGRKTKGVLAEINPNYIHDFGEFQTELLQIEMQLKKIMRVGDC